MSFEIASNNYLPSLASLGIKIPQLFLKSENTSNASTLSQADFTSISKLTRTNNSRPFLNSPHTLNFVSKSDVAPSFAQVRKGDVMQKGDKGEPVKELQKKLSSLGYSVDSTGNFGNTTELKLKQFQKDNGIAQTGKLGKTTITALDNVKRADLKVGLGKPTVLGTKIANAARREASNRSTYGWCYAGVASALDRVKGLGAYLYGSSAYMAAPILAKSPEFKEVKVKTSDLPKLAAGTVVVWGKTPDSPHGHISVALGNGQEASDHITDQLTSLRGYTNARVFTPVA